MSIKKRLFAVLCALCCLFCCTFSASAAAGLFGSVFIDDDYDVEGSEPITVSEAVYALAAFFGTDNNKIANAFEFKVNSSKNVVEVYEGDDFVEVVFVNSDGNYEGLGSGLLVLGSDIPDVETDDVDSIDGIISVISADVKGVFSLISAGFSFITSNDLCMFIISISFAGVSLAFVRRCFHVARG